MLVLRTRTHTWRMPLQRKVQRYTKEAWPVQALLPAWEPCSLLSGPVRWGNLCWSGLQKWVVFAEGGAASLYLWLEPVPAAGLKAVHRLHWRISSFLTWVPFFGSLSTDHFRSASLHHRSICHVNWGTRGSFSFGLVYWRIPRGIQNVLTQINGTNKSEISLAT